MYDLNAYYEANPLPPAKGSLSRLTERLVRETTLSYEEIVAKVREEFPDANTTTRSVASVACVLRKSGVDVPMRIKRKEKQLALSL